MIWGIQIRKHGRGTKPFDLAALARSSEGFTGAEIEQAFIDALYQSFCRNEEPTQQAVLAAIGDTVPLSKLMGDQINALRKWAKGRARPATTGSGDKVERRLMVGTN